MLLLSEHLSLNRLSRPHHPRSVREEPSAMGWPTLQGFFVGLVAVPSRLGRAPEELSIPMGDQNLAR